MSDIPDDILPRCEFGGIGEPPDKPFFTAEDCDVLQIKSGKRGAYDTVIRSISRDAANAKVAPLIAENERLKAALEKIAQMDGTMMIHQVVDEALKND